MLRFLFPFIVFHSSIYAIESEPPTPFGNPNDQLSLLSFKSLISDDPSGALASWNDSLNFCLWNGVTCGHRHPERVTALDLDALNLAGIVSPYLANLTFLRSLSLADNQLHGQIPLEFGFLSRLQHLNLSFNSFEGEIPLTLSHCSKLHNISLGNNKLTGEIPGNLSHCPDLQLISLASNMLVGHIPNELGFLPKLKILNLINNNMSGGIPYSLGNLSSLTVLRLSHNILSGGIPPSLGKLVSITIITISHNHLSGMIPSSLYNLSGLYHLSIADNQLIGTLPHNMGMELPNLQFIYMYENQFHGTVPTSLSNASQLNTIDVSDNNFHGAVPETLGLLESLSWLSLEKNRLGANGWSFLAALSNCSLLRVLQMHDNNLGGTLPSTLSNLSAHMEWLTLAWNGISGDLPAEIGNLKNLTVIYIGNNLLTGTIPPSIGKLQRLEVLSLSRNQFSGEVPSSIGNLTQLSRMYLAGTDLTGRIPTYIGNCSNLELLDLSYNMLVGSIPEEVVSISSLSRYLHLSHNSLNGSIPSEVGRLKNLKELDVSNNDLSGKIPSSLGDCQVLQILHMSGNFFEGTIPDSLRNLKGIQELDVSNNNLSGNIPDFFVGFHFLQYLNLSYNHFEGEMLHDGVFQNTSAVSVAGNVKLCGGSPAYHLQPCFNEGPQQQHKSHAIIVIVSVIGAVLGLILLIALITCCLWTNRLGKESPSVASLDHYSILSYAQLRKATDGFSEANLLGSGSFGCVYKGVMEEGENAIAVKVLNLQQRGALRSFIAECETLKNVRHRNLMKILNTCSGVDFNGNEFRSLVFEYMPNGSLEKWLHSREHRTGILDLKQRLNIAIDVASALYYLHHQCHTTIVHCDLKPSNILLDNDMKALVGDFGLARFLPNPSSQVSKNTDNSIEIKGTIGYVAPEYGVGTKASTKGDVYSYGILILEIFTGRKPTDDEFKDNQGLRQFVEMAFPQQVMDIVDLHLLSLEEEDDMLQLETRMKIQECLVSVVRVGLSCSQESPRERMEMGEVSREMHAIRERFLQDKSYAQK